jgi:hypothetical protein
MAIENINVFTQALATAANSKLVGEAFSRLLMVSSTTKDVFGQMEGPEGSRRPFITKTDLSKGRASTVNFSVTANAGHMPRRGEQKLQGSEERLRMNSFGVKVDIVRHAIGLNEKVKQFLAAGMSLEEAYQEVLSSHLGRFKETDMKMALRNKATAANTVRPNNKASLDELTSADVVNTSVLGEALGNLTMLGAKEISVSKSKAGADVLRFLIFGTVNGLTPLKTNSQYLAAVQAAGVRGDNNTIFSGGFVDWDGMGIYGQNIVDPDAEGPIGDPLEPRALLGTALTAGTTARTVTGGGINGPATNALYFRWFYGFDYLWTEDQTAAPDAGVYYFVIYNTTGADRGKFGVYQYTGSSNDGQEIECSAHLGATAAGVQVTTLAGQTWNSAKHTTAHPAGSMIIQVNAKCVPVVDLFGLGVASGLRAYGSIPMQKIEQLEDYGFDKGMGYMSIYGQDVAKDTNLQPRHYTRIQCAYKVPGVTLPVVTD